MPAATKTFVQVVIVDNFGFRRKPSLSLRPVLISLRSTFCCCFRTPMTLQMETIALL